MGGLEKIGIRMNLDDFQRLFDLIDFDQAGEIDFRKFCLLNVDKIRDTHNYIHDLKLKQGEGILRVGKKPPLPHMPLYQSYVNTQKNSSIVALIDREGSMRHSISGGSISFASGTVPKNKDYSKFANDVQQFTRQELMNIKRRKIKVPSQKD